VACAMAEPLPGAPGWRVRSRQRRGHGDPGSGDGHPEVGWHPQHASMPSVGDSNSNSLASMSGFVQQFYRECSMLAVYQNRYFLS